MLLMPSESESVIIRSRAGGMKDFEENMHRNMETPSFVDIPENSLVDGAKVKSEKQTLWPTLRLLFCAACWFSASVYSTIVNKSLMGHFPFPLSLTGLHLLAGITFNLALSRPAKNGGKVSATYKQILPCAFFMIASKVFTYVSYGRVPASLTHTVKATSPIFSVLISHFHLKQPVSGCIVLALFPITVGVTLSSVTEINFELLGFFAALLSTLIGVLQNIFTKKGLRVESNPVLLNLHVNIWAFGMLVVFGIFTEFPRLYETILQSYEPQYPILNNESVPNPPQDTIAIQDMQVGQMLLSSMLVYYLQSISSIFVLKQVTAVTHQVSATIKRLVIIVASVWYFGNPVTLMNSLGMGLAVAGFFAYGYLNKKTQKPEPVCMSSTRMHGMNGGTNHVRTNGWANNHVRTNSSHIRTNGRGPPQIVVDVANKFRANNEFVNGVREVMSEVLVPLSKGVN